MITESYLDPLDPRVGKAINFILKNWDHEKETLIQFRDRIFKEGHSTEHIPSYDDYMLPCGCHESPGAFGLHVDCKNPEHLNYKL